jgi:hypothetical protein
MQSDGFGIILERLSSYLVRRGYQASRINCTELRRMIMNRKLIIVALLFGMMICSSSASADYLVGLTDVGGLDTLLTSTTLGDSGDATETNWVQGYLRDNGYISLTDTISLLWKPSGGWVSTDTPGTWAFEFLDASTTPPASYEPEWFLVKIGAGHTGANDHYLFKNEASLAWAVVQFAQFGFTTMNIGRISHVGLYGGTTVPEPTTILLLGSGLIGLFACRRKFRS